MKRTLIILSLVMATFVFCGASCNQNPQRTAYNSIFSVEQTAAAAVDGYYAAVIKGQARTNEVPNVSAAFNELQAACTLAASVDQAGTNAIAPAALTSELLQLTSLIATLIPTK